MADANTVRVTTVEVQTIITGNSEIDSVRTTTYEIQAVSSIFNKTCIVAVSC